MKMTVRIVLFLLVCGLTGGCSRSEEDVKASLAPSSADVTGSWTGKMKIEFYSGRGGGSAPVLLLLLMDRDGGLTGTFSDPSCPGEPACPHGESLDGTYDHATGKVDIKFVFDCKTDLVNYHYSMTGEVRGSSMEGSFTTLDDSGRAQSKGTWSVSRE